METDWRRYVLHYTWGGRDGHEMSFLDRNSDHARAVGRALRGCDEGFTNVRVTTEESREIAL